MSGLSGTDVSGGAFSSAVTLTLDVQVAAGRSVAINCTVAGNVSLQLSSGTAYVVPVQVGFQTLPFAVTAINSSGTTATATYANLY